VAKKHCVKNIKSQKNMLENLHINLRAKNIERSSIKI